MNRRRLGRAFVAALFATWTAVASLFARRGRRPALIAAVRGMTNPALSRTTGAAASAIGANAVRPTN